MTAEDFLEGLLVGLAISLMVVSLLWWTIRRRLGHHLGQPPSSSAIDEPSPPVSVPDQTPYGPAAGGLAEEGERSTIEPTAPEGPTSSTEPSTVDGDLRLSSRILLHLASQPPLASGFTFAKAQSQGGMVEALGVAQGPLANVLRRLVASGLVSESREHVRGGSRRVKVYRLSSAGEQLARDLRHPRLR